MKTALVLFSGGFDSVAVALKIITEGDYERIDLLYENNTAFEDLSSYADNLYTKLLFFAKKYKVDLRFEVRKSYSDWIDYDKLLEDLGGRELCLMIHLTTLFGEGSYQDFYLGWNKSNVKKLKYSKKLLKFMEKYMKEESKLYFLEDLFLEEGEEDYSIELKASLTKKRVISYLLDNKLFSYCSAAGYPGEDVHWYDIEKNQNSTKWREVVDALLDLGFDSKELASIFESNKLETVQLIWNKRNKVEKKA